MRKGKRMLERKNTSNKILLTIGLIFLSIIIVMIITFSVYNNRLKQINDSLINTETIAQIIPDEFANTEVETSTNIGKSIDEVIQNIDEDIEEKKKTIENKEQEIVEIGTEKVEEKKLEFCYPVEGEISINFANDTLVYSETLEEWITHLGIDIKADRATVVQASEEGEIVAIKNDPRYGLTVIIEHRDGFKTVYSNLLSSEFVSEGEKVEKGQAIGTVGNSAAFEIMEEPHLHFEILKDNVNVDPKLYIN